MNVTWCLPSNYLGETPCGEGASRMVATKIDASNGSVSKRRIKPFSKSGFGSRIPTNLCPISFDGSVVDYRGDNGYGELGFDSG